MGLGLSLATAVFYMHPRMCVFICFHRATEFYSLGRLLLARQTTHTTPNHTWPYMVDCVHTLGVCTYVVVYLCVDTARLFWVRFLRWCRPSGIIVAYC